MPEPVVAELHSWLSAHEPELLDCYRSLLRIPSLKSDPAPDAPFGIENRRALDYMLGLASESGMRTSDLEGYCGYAEFGSGAGLVTSFGHLDVVPVGPGWKHEPFGAEIDEGYVYSRGAVDDKGPTIASFFACRALQAVLADPGVRIRQFFGCDEESGFACLHRYNQTEEPPTFGIAPDSGWPLYHAEKGIANLFVEVEPPQGELALLSVEGGQRGNIVIDSCTARFRASRQTFEPKVRELWDRNVEWRWEGDDLVLEASGKAVHGSVPHLGDNAATRIFRTAREIAPPLEKRAYEDLVALAHPGGDGLGVSGRDEPSGALTSNLGVVRTLEGRLSMQFNVRYPVTWPIETLQGLCEQGLGKLALKARLVNVTDSRPLYFPLDHPLVETIVDVYAEETGERKAPGVMGGGTYARAIANTVSVGTGWPGDGEAHETDERLAVTSLFKMSRIYAHVLLRLSRLATYPK